MSYQLNSNQYPDYRITLRHLGHLSLWNPAIQLKHTQSLHLGHQNILSGYFSRLQNAQLTVFAMSILHLHTIGLVLKDDRCIHTCFHFISQACLKNSKIYHTANPQVSFLRDFSG